MPTLEILRSLHVEVDLDETSEEGIDIRPILSRCPHIYKLSVLHQIEKLPEVNQFSPNLTKLTLNSTRLAEDPMPTLEKLQKLKILEVHLVFEGKNMVCSARGFPQLQSLQLSRFENLEEWTVEEGAMPSLCRLEILSCVLKMVPEGLRFVTTLQELLIRDLLKEFTDRVHKGGQDFYKIQHVPSVVIEDWEPISDYICRSSGCQWRSRSHNLVTVGIRGGKFYGPFMHHFSATMSFLRNPVDPTLCSQQNSRFRAC